MDVYLSHSYRDDAINGYFRRYFEEEEISLGVDQKTDVWCAAKLERYANEIAGVVSIIPRRVSETDPGAYSAYIGQELNMARRSRVPRLLLIDEIVHRHHRLDFPSDAVIFSPDALDGGHSRYIDAIRRFRSTLDTTFRPPKTATKGTAAVIRGPGRMQRDAARDVEELLQRVGYAVTRPLGKDPEHGLNDIRMLEKLWTAEVCVFLFGERLSDAHIALAMAHAHCIPSVRLQYTAGWTDSNPTLSGVIRWGNPADMLVELTRQIESYMQGLVKPTVETSVMKWRPKDDQNWDLRDGAGLVNHVRPEHVVVRDEVNRAAGRLGTAIGRISSREDTCELFRVLYEGFQRHRFAYELEMVSETPGTQAIRSPANIASHRTATCIDIACLFAAMLEAAGQNALIVVFEGDGFSHALAGYRVRDEPPSASIDLDDLRGAIARRDVVLFEVTGALEADSPVGAEFSDDRQDKLLRFLDARGAAERMIRRPDIAIRHYLDIRAQRAEHSRSNN